MSEQNLNFDINPYLNYFRNNKYHFQTLLDIEKVYSSNEYSQFINNIYEFFNQNSQKSEIKLNTINCLTVKKIIDHFWTLLLGPDLIKKYTILIKKPKNLSMI